MRFEEYIRKTAPLSYRDYMRYWGRYHSIIESLGFERLPCNKWVLKLASKWLSWAAAEGRISLEEEARARRLLALKRLECERMVEGARGEGWERCREWDRVELDEKEWARTLQEAILWSGARLKYLWLLPGFQGKETGRRGLQPMKRLSRPGEPVYFSSTHGGCYDMLVVNSRSSKTIICWLWGGTGYAVTIWGRVSKLGAWIQGFEMSKSGVVRLVAGERYRVAENMSRAEGAGRRSNSIRAG